VTDEPLYATWGFTDAEWGLLTGLPQAVLTAASAATPDSARKTRAENEAGQEKISEARASASPLVTAVASAVLDVSGDPELGEEAPVIEPADPIGYARDVIVRAADTVVGAASTGGVLGVGGEPVTADERAFRDRLAEALTG
jgi:hypothetical protein